VEFQESKREIIGFSEVQKEREERIDRLKSELRELKIKHEDLDMKHGTLNIKTDRLKEQYDSCKQDLEDAIEKLHTTNKVAHETEVKLNEQIEKTTNYQEILKDKEELLRRRAVEIDELDRKQADLGRANEALTIKKDGIERQFELTKKQQSEKIANLNEILNQEKDTRDMWIERYEKEQREHTQTTAMLLQTKSSFKDQVLTTKNAEIKLETQVKAGEILEEQNAKLQEDLNATLAKNENVERELNTQKVILSQVEATKKGQIDKLKAELGGIEGRFLREIEHINMVSEQFHSQARENLANYLKFKAESKEQ
jgi:chromosome segregation ATPase